MLHRRGSLQFCCGSGRKIHSGLDLQRVRNELESPRVAMLLYVVSNPTFLVSDRPYGALPPIAPLIGQTILRITSLPRPTFQYWKRIPIVLCLRFFGLVKESVYRVLLGFYKKEEILVRLISYALHSVNVSVIFTTIKSKFTRKSCTVDFLA